jgi:hypothetical protein
MKKQFLFTLLCMFMVTLRGMSQIAYPPGGNLMTLPPLSGNNSYYDLCYSGLVGDCSFTVGATAPASVLISVPKGTCLLDNSLALLGTYQNSTTYYDNYTVTGLTANSTYTFKVDLSAVDCQFFSINTPEPVQVKVFDAGANNTRFT